MSRRAQCKPAAQRIRFQRLPHGRQSLLHQGIGRRGHAHTAIPFRDEQALLHQLAEGLAQHRPPDAKSLGERFLLEPLSRGKPAGQDLDSQAALQLVGYGHDVIHNDAARLSSD